MGNVLVKEETLTEIADSIREKNGLPDKYKPAEMPEAIRNISTGSDDGPSEDDPIRFYGLEGELLYSYTLEEMKELTELPSLPECEGLICQGWNWSLENLQALDREMDVGAIFITDDGSTRIYVSLTECTLHPYLGIYQKASDCVKIDWGDGSPLESSAVINQVIWFDHQYGAPGEYVVRLVPEEDASVYVYGSIGGTNLFQRGTEKNRSNCPYSNTIQKIEIGKGIKYLGEYGLVARNLKYVTIPNEIIDFREALRGCINLRYIAIPNSITKLYGNTFNGCTRLEKVCFPDNMTDILGDAFRECIKFKTACLPETITSLYTGIFLACDSLKSITFPETLKAIPSSVVSGCNFLENVRMGTKAKEINSQAFYNCKGLKKIEISPNVTKIGSSAFYGNEVLDRFELPESLVTIENGVFHYCYGLVEMTIPKNVTAIGNNAFYGCMGIENYYFYPETPPTLGTNVFNSIHADCKIHVPKGCLEAYQTAENWDNYANRMVEMEE